MSGGIVPEEIRPVLENGIPVWLVTSSADGVPNVSIVSDVYYVDGDHLAVSFQFFNKTVRNVRENPYAVIQMNDVDHARFWVLEVEYRRSETEGPIFDEMSLRIEAIAATTGMSGIFRLRAADIYRVHSVRSIEAG